MADDAGAPWLVLGGAERVRWTMLGYTDRAAVSRRTRMTVITPPALIEVLRAGWEPVVPLLHPSA